MPSARRISACVITQLVPSATITTRGSVPAARRSPTMSRPCAIWRQPRASTSKPAPASWSAAPSITESPIASGARAWPWRWRAWTCFWASHAKATPGASSQSANAAAVATVLRRD
jgi:hypothetical protein